MIRMLRIGIGLVFALTLGALLSACASAPTPTAAPTDRPQPATPAPQASTSAADIALLRPDAPAGEGEDFRPDSPLVVAMTGRPQLIEVFSYD